MEIIFDNAGFSKALKQFFHADIERNICVKDSGKILAGCGFSKIKNGVTYAFLLRLYPAWASRAYYAALLRFPFEQMDAEKVIAYTSTNKKSARVCEHLGGEKRSDSVFIFHKEKCLANSISMLNHTLMDNSV